MGPRAQTQRRGEQMRIWRMVFLAIVSWAASAAAQQASTNSSSAAPQRMAAISPAPSNTTIHLLPDYQIGTTDTLQVDVFGVPELSQTVQVDNSGNIELPLIGRVLAQGATTSELAKRIAAQLNGKFVKDPVVSVTVKDPSSQKVTVDGSVTQPGVYEIAPHTTLTQAIALAKGPDQVANTSDVAIIRTGPNGRVVTSYDLDAIHDGKTVDPFVQANDEIVVDVSGTRRFVRDFGSVISFLGFWRP